MSGNNKTPSLFEVNDSDDLNQLLSDYWGPSISEENFMNVKEFVSHLSLYEDIESLPSRNMFHEHIMFLNGNKASSIDRIPRKGLKLMYVCNFKRVHDLIMERYLNPNRNFNHLSKI